MTLDEFKAATHSPDAPRGLAAPLLALWQDARGDWESAHRSVQDESTREAAWVHAYLHRKEGDEGNAGYWYTRAGRKFPEADVDQEWESIAAELLDAS